jgi:hypothetical protein
MTAGPNIFERMGSPAENGCLHTPAGMVANGSVCRRRANGSHRELTCVNGTILLFRRRGEGRKNLRSGFRVSNGERGVRSLSFGFLPGTNQKVAGSGGCRQLTAVEKTFSRLEAERRWSQRSKGTSERSSARLEKRRGVAESPTTPQAEIGLSLFLHQFATGAAEELINEIGGVDAAAEVRVLQDGLLEGNGGLDAGDHVFAQGAAHLVHGFTAVFAVGDELADHGIVSGRNGVAGIGMAVDADSPAPGRVIHFDAARAWTEFVKGIFGVDAAFDGVAFELDVALGMLEGFAHGDHDLVANEVDAGDFFGNRMLNLDAFVHFQEVVIAVVVDDEFDGASIGIMGEFGDLDGGLAHFVAELAVLALDQRRRGFFDDLLIAPLDGAVAFAEMDDVALVVREDLKFDVVRVFDEFFDVDTGVAEGFLSFGTGGMIAFDERDVVVGNAHAASTATGDGLDHDGVTNALGNGKGVLLVFHDAFGTGRDGHTSFLGKGATDGLVLHRVHRARAWSDEPDVAAFADVGKVSVFGEETVAGMNGIDIRYFGGTDKAIDAQITLIAGGFTDANGLVGKLDMHGVGILVGINGDSTDVQLFASANNSDCNFSAVGYQDFFKHG